MKLSQKKYIVLQELYNLKDDGNYHDLSSLELKGLSKSYEELRYIGEALFDDQLINYSPSKMDICARITFKGIELIEGITEISFDSKYQFNDYEIASIRSRLDDLFEEIVKLQRGQEIIYDDLSQEIDSLKRLLEILNKSEWRQIFKGKLLELGIDRIESIVNAVNSTFTDFYLLNNQ